MWMIKISHAPTLYFEVLLVLLGTFRHFKVFLGIWGTSSYFEVLLRTSEYCEVIWGSFRVLSPQSSVFSLQSSVLTPLFWVLNPHFLVLREVLTCVTWFLMQKTVFVASETPFTAFLSQISRESQHTHYTYTDEPKNISLTKLGPPDQYSHIITIRAPVRAKNTNSNSNTNHGF